MGIGLALEQQLVEQHGGTISAYSKGTGHGASFTIRLPLCRQKELSTTVAPQINDHSLADMGVLVIDDSEDTVDMLRRLLEMNGAHVRGAYSGTEALQIVEEDQFDVIVSDVAMPGMDGFEFLRRLRALPEHRDVPVLAPDWIWPTEDIERAQSPGFFSHITKPFDLEALAETLQKAKEKAAT
jgi:two-component system CheB/CheR fusion protein